MRRLFAFVILLLLVSNIKAQPGVCRTPMPESAFNQRFRTIAMQKSDQMRLEAANALAVGNCLSTQQVKSIAALFIDDLSRLEFAQTAYANTVDKENYYFVYDDFAYFSTVFMLHDYITGIERQPFDPLPPQNAPVNLNFPALDYPDAMNYKGPVNCRQPLAEVDFMSLTRQYAFNNNEQNRLSLFTQIVRDNCVSVAQVMKLASLLDNENNRLPLFIAALPNIYDKGNLSFGVQLFSHIPNRSAFNDMINNSGNNPPAVPECRVTREEFSDMLQSIKKETFNSTKLTITKNILRSRPCFLTPQVRDIVNEFSFESGKLEIAKFAWDYTLDKENYYRVADAFSFSSSKEELIKFIESKL